MGETSTAEGPSEKVDNRHLLPLGLIIVFGIFATTLPCGLIQGPLGGLLATVGFMWATGTNAVLALTIFPIAYIFLREQRVAQGEHPHQYVRCA